MIRILAALLCLMVAPIASAHAPAAIATDPPHDAAHPARMEVVHIPAADGSIMNGVFWLPNGAGPHPVALILHGFPGNEQNLDIALTLRRAGWAVLTFHYRGSWGSGGTFSFTHVFEDSQTALDFIRQHAGQYALDPHRITVIGHSMGGMAATLIGAHNPDLAGVVLVSAANFGQIPSLPGGHAGLVRFMSGNMESLAGTSPEALADEAIANAAAWNFLKTAPGLAHAPVLVVTANDGLAPADAALAKAVNHAAARDATIRHLDTDHGYSDSRIALQAIILDWLAAHPAAAIRR